MSYHFVTFPDEMPLAGNPGRPSSMLTVESSGLVCAARFGGILGRIGVDRL